MLNFCVKSQKKDLSKNHVIENDKIQCLMASIAKAENAVYSGYF